MIDWDKLWIWAALGFSIAVPLVSGIFQFLGHRESRIRYEKEKVYGKQQMPRQNGKYLVKQSSQQLKQLKRQMSGTIQWPIGTNDCIFDVYPIRQMISQFRSKDVRIINKDILSTSYEYESIYDRPKERPGIFGSLLIGICGTLALLPEICIKVLHPGKEIDYNVISGPTVGFLKCSVELLSDCWMVAQYQIDGNEEKILLLGLSKEDILEYYRRRQWSYLNSVLLFSLLSILLYKPLKAEIKKLVNWYRAKDKLRITTKLLSVELDQQLNCIICLSKCRNIVFKKCRHFAVCSSCMKNKQADIDKCPLCREDIDELIEVHDCEERRSCS